MPELPQIAVIACGGFLKTKCVMKTKDQPINPCIMQQVGVNEYRLQKPSDASQYTLHTRKTMFRTEYNTYIPIKALTECEFNELMTDENNGDQLIYKTYKSKKITPILHKIREESIEYLKSTNRLTK